MATQQPFAAMRGQRGIAARALRHVTAAAAEHEPAAAAPVDEEHALLAALDPRRPAPAQARSRRCACCRFRTPSLSRRCARAASAAPSHAAQRYQFHLPAHRRLVAFERRRRTAEHQHAAGSAHSLARDRDGMIARHGLLFVRRFRAPRRRRSSRTFGSGAKIALRAPTTTSISPRAQACHASKRSRSESAECSTATRSPKLSSKRRAVCGVSEISGTSTIARPPSRTTRLIAST